MRMYGVENLRMLVGMELWLDVQGGRKHREDKKAKEEFEIKWEIQKKDGFTESRAGERIKK